MSDVGLEQRWATPTGAPPRPRDRVRRAAALALGSALAGRSFATAFREMERAPWLSPEEVQARAEARLAPLLRHTAEHVPFYRETYRRLGLAPGSIRTLEELRRLPVVNKAMHRKQPADHFLAANLPPHRRVPSSTSGSTGEPFWFWLDRQALPLQWASFLALDAWYDLGPFARSTRLRVPTAVDSAPAGMPLSARLRAAITDRLRAFYKARTQDEILLWSVDGAGAEAIHRRLEAFRPDYVSGYSAMLATLAGEWLRRDLRLTRPVRAVVVCAETLTDSYRQILQQCFGCPIINRYGLRETGGWNAQSCTRAPEQFHVNSEMVIWETVREDGTPAAPGETGRVLLTDLHNYVMPFIRYDTGDLAQMSAAPCPCGRSWPVVARLVGRTQECLRTPSGKFIAPADLGYSLFLSGERVENVSHFQLIQETADRVRLLIVPDPGFTGEHRARLHANMEAMLGEDVAVTVEIVAAIRGESSGKRPIIKKVCNE